MEDNKTNLLENSDSIQDIQLNAMKENVTQVTSIAEEEKRTGKKIEVPNAEELVAKASSSLINNQMHLNKIINRKNGGTKFAISRAGMNRVLNAILSLPLDGVPIRLQGEDEKAAFIFGQNIIRDMFVIMANHAFTEAVKAKENTRQNNNTSDNLNKSESIQTKGE